MRTLAPASNMAFAMPNPIPVPPPVISAVLFSKENAFNDIYKIKDPAYARTAFKLTISFTKLTGNDKAMQLIIFLLGLRLAVLPVNSDESMAAQSLTISVPGKACARKVENKFRGQGKSNACGIARGIGTANDCRKQ